MFVPGGTHEQAGWFNEIQRMTAPPGMRHSLLGRCGRYQRRQSIGTGSSADIGDACTGGRNGTY
jgi:hypothetical protein